MRKKVYLASPFFTDEQRALRDKVLDVLTYADFNIYSPGHENLITDDSTPEQQQLAFKENLCQIDNCDFVLAVGNDYDTGTMIEIGYAFKANKPVIYFNNSSDGKKRNLMLAGASFVSFASLLELAKFLSVFDNYWERVE